MPRASIIIQLQNNPRFAELCLLSLERQSVRDVEIIIIADNASPDVVRTVKTRLPFISIPAKVVWSAETRPHSSTELQLLRTALSNAQTEYLIFISSNSILHREFVNEHCANQSHATMLTASRVELSPTISESLSTDDIRGGWLEYKYWRVLMDGIFGQSTGVLRGLYFTSALMRLLGKRRQHHLFAANFSMSKVDCSLLIQSLENNADSDFRTLLQGGGLRILKLPNTFIQYHLNEDTQPVVQFIPTVMERVRRIRYKVPEFGLQPAMFRNKPSSSRQRRP